MSACVALRGASSALVVAERDHADETLSSLSTVRHETSRSDSGVRPASNAFASMFAAGHHRASSGVLALAPPSPRASLLASEGCTKKGLPEIGHDLPPRAIVRVVRGHAVKGIIR